MNIKKVKNKTIRSLGGQMLKGYFLKALLFLICCEIMGRSVSYILYALAPESRILSVLSDVYYLIIQGPIFFGKAIFFLWMFRGQPVGFNSLVHAFDYFKKDVTLFAYIFFRCFILSLLFVIPGVICLIRCSQAFYILADDPTKSPSQCLMESRKIMKGFEGKYFSFIISYAGWMILAAVPQFAVSSFLTEVPAVIVDYAEYFKTVKETAQSPLMVLCEVFILMVMVYASAGTACYYDILTGKLVFKTDQCEDDIQ